MKHDEHLLTAALALVRQCAALTPREPDAPRQSGCRSDGSYEPQCLMTWATQVQAMDETVRAAR